MLGLTALVGIRWRPGWRPWFEVMVLVDIAMWFSYCLDDLLVVWNIWIIFPFSRNFIIPTDELIFFRGVETTNQDDLLYFSKGEPEIENL